MVVSFHVTNRYFAPAGAKFRTYTGYVGDSEQAATVTVTADRDWWPGEVVEIDLEPVRVDDDELGEGGELLAEEVEEWLRGQVDK